jgi:hypothetical protein
LSICASLEQNVAAGNFEMMVLLFKNVRNFVTEEMLMQSLKDMKFNKNEYDKLKRQIEATPNLERLI